MIRLLTFSTLYPSAARPAHGVFVEQRLRHLLASGAASAVVVAPVSWFPSTNRRFGEYAALAATPREEERHGVRVLHPRYPLPPRAGMTIAPLTLALSARATLRRLLAEGLQFDVIDAHYFYPDGVAAALLAHWFDRPFTITARGTDVTVLPRYRLPRAMIRWAGRRAAAIATVCEALRDEVLGLGLPADRVRVLRNGVDLQRFRPLDQAAARQSLGMSDRTLLSVGLLIPRKGHDLVIEALCELPELKLVIVGDGPGEAALRRRAHELGVADRVRFDGHVSHDRLPAYYSAAAALVLASSREGLANVLLEALACGTPVIATDVNGTREAVSDAAAGVLLAERSAAAIVAGVRQLFSRRPQRTATRAHAEQFSWDAATRGQIDMFRATLRMAGRGA
jgi:glycosyltransferase involved in cell wall biosynthesis